MFVRFSRVRLFVTRWTVAYQASLSMGFSRREYWSGLLFPSPGDLPDPGIKPRSPALQTDALPSEPPGKPLLYTRRTQMQAGPGKGLEYQGYKNFKKGQATFVLLLYGGYSEMVLPSEVMFYKGTNSA